MGDVFGVARAQDKVLKDASNGQSLKLSSLHFPCNDG